MVTGTQQSILQLILAGATPMSSHQQSTAVSLVIIVVCAYGIIKSPAYFTRIGEWECEGEWVQINVFGSKNIPGA